ncbi:hypothetical protein F5Y16DRAFT_406566 [Xylariaceae sp. FL0255]|nr:hypothetical protein F5Y16DRAFT_406566 [Xylariaceae sp. FL0255]
MQQTSRPENPRDVIPAWDSEQAVFTGGSRDPGSGALTFSTLHLVANQHFICPPPRSPSNAALPRTRSALDTSTNPRFSALGLTVSQHYSDLGRLPLLTRFSSSSEKFPLIRSVASAFYTLSSSICSSCLFFVVVPACSLCADSPSRDFPSSLTQTAPPFVSDNVSHTSSVSPRSFSVFVDLRPEMAMPTSVFELVESHQALAAHYRHLVAQGIDVEWNQTRLNLIEETIHIEIELENHNTTTTNCSEAAVLEAYCLLDDHAGDHTQ